jgi:hypothetical protein
MQKAGNPHKSDTISDDAEWHSGMNPNKIPGQIETGPHRCLAEGDGLL